MFFQTGRKEDSMEILHSPSYMITSTSSQEETVIYVLSAQEITLRANTLSVLYSPGMASGHQQLQVPKFSVSERRTSNLGLGDEF